MVQWIRYADNRVTDAVAFGENKEGALLARCSSDGSVAVYNGSGDELARWNVGEPMREIQAVPVAKGFLFVVAAEKSLKTALYAP